MEGQIISELAANSPVALLAMVIFFMYRRDKKTTEDRLTNLLEEDQKTRADSTKVTTELITWLKRKNGTS